MAYNRQVVWLSPYSARTLPMGKYGIRYTYVIVDVPNVQYKRTIWREFEYYIASGDPAGEITFTTSIPYTKSTLKVFVNGKEIDYEEDTRRKKERFTVKDRLIDRKYIHCSYLPQLQSMALGDNTGTLSKVYGIMAATRYGGNIREILHTMRKYITGMKHALILEPPLWIGGMGNEEIGVAKSLLPTITPISVEKHLQPIRDSIIELAASLRARGFSGVSVPEKVEYTVGFIEALQLALIEADKGLEKVIA